MRLTELLITCALFIALMGGILQGVRRSFNLAEKTIEVEKKAMCLTFVSESFRATCDGKGFESLKDWQVACRAMYKLDYIGFSSESDFCYGSWSGPYGGGEVIEKLKKQKEEK